MFITSVVLTVIFYVLIVYVSYITSQILYIGVTSRLMLSVIKSSLFILVAYTSIISDVILFYILRYDSISIKNGLLLFLLSTSLVAASSRKETKSEHTRE
ncbi:hypothetical protein Goe24_00510 [Bacillus phage vB_BsuM-Goe24]|nr:hypothetical protein Goe24_00510 [Bacillus phage vB_BsuM-Goe24]